MYKYGDFPCRKKTLTWINSFTLEKENVQGWCFWILSPKKVKAILISKYVLFLQLGYFAMDYCP